MIPSTHLARVWAAAYAASLGARTAAHIAAANGEQKIPDWLNHTIQQEAARDAAAAASLFTKWDANQHD